MSPRDLAVLENILIFREKRAMKRDLPPFKIFGNNVVKILVKKQPTDRKALEKIRELPASFTPRYAKDILKAINKGLSLSEKNLPSYPKTPRPPSNPGKQKRLKQLKAWREVVAKKLKLEPGLVCNNVLLENIAQENPDSMAGLNDIPGMKQWQQRELGKQIVKILKRD
jgi:ribonuclease D